MMKRMKTFMVILPLSTMTLFVALPTGANAQTAVLEVIKAGVKKVIKAMDLKTQRLQNQTIWLQNAQKVLENQLSKLKLTEIADWTEKQRDLYRNYYEELWKVKATIAYLSKIKALSTTQLDMLDQYHWAWNLLLKSEHFSADELSVMEKVYAGILQKSVTNIDQILVVVNSFKTQMSDAARLALITQAANEMDSCWADLKSFNRENYLISIQRAKSADQVSKLKVLYGLDQ